TAHADGKHGTEDHEIGESGSHLVEPFAHLGAVPACRDVFGRWCIGQGNASPRESCRDGSNGALPRLRSSGYTVTAEFCTFSLRARSRRPGFFYLIGSTVSTIPVRSGKAPSPAARRRAISDLSAANATP